MKMPFDELGENHQNFHLTNAICSYIKSVKLPQFDIYPKSEYMRVWPEYVVGLQLLELSFKALIVKARTAPLGGIKGHNIQKLFGQLKPEEREAYNEALAEFAQEVHPGLPAVSLNDDGNWNIMGAHRYYPLEGGFNWNEDPPTEVPDIFRVSVWHIREMLFVSHLLLDPPEIGKSPYMGKFYERLIYRKDLWYDNDYKPHSIPTGVPGNLGEEDTQLKLRELKEMKRRTLGKTLEDELRTALIDGSADNILKTDIVLFLFKLRSRQDLVEEEIERIKRYQEDEKQILKDVFIPTDEELIAMGFDPSEFDSDENEPMGRWLTDPE